LIGGFEAHVGGGDLLAEGVVRHQRIDDGGCGQAGDGQALDAVDEGAAADFTVDEIVVEQDGFFGQLGLGRGNWVAPCGVKRDYTEWGWGIL